VSCREDKGGGNMTSVWECIPCGYRYNPREGDAEGGIAPGTSFEELPDDWVCPLCGVGKDQFKKIGIIF